jgi:hypothetical protein
MSNFRFLCAPRVSEDSITHHQVSQADLAVADLIEKPGKGHKSTSVRQSMCEYRTGGVLVYEKSMRVSFQKLSGTCE